MVRQGRSIRGGSRSRRRSRATLRWVAPKLVFVMAGFVVGVALGPSIADDNHRAAPSPGSWVQLEGRVLTTQALNNTEAQVPAHGARIQVGADSATVDATGAFRLWTWAPAPSSVVAVVTYREQAHIEWVSIPPEAQTVLIEIQVPP